MKVSKLLKNASLPAAFLLAVCGSSVSEAPESEASPSAVPSEAPPIIDFKKVAHIENKQMNYSRDDPSEEVSEEDEFCHSTGLYSFHADTAFSIMDETLKSSDKKIQTTNLNERYQNILDARDVYIGNSIVNISSVLVNCGTPAKGNRKKSSNFWHTESEAIVIKSVGNKGSEYIDQLDLNYDDTFLGDTTIRTGAVARDGSLESYSSVGADLVGLNPFTVGYSTVYNPTAKEAEKLVDEHDGGTFYPELVSKHAGQVRDDVKGTSFSSPKLAGDIAPFVIKYRELGMPSYAIWAALLSTAYHQDAAPVNQVGFRYDPAGFGFGVVDLARAEEVLETVLQGPQDIENDQKYVHLQLKKAKSDDETAYFLAGEYFIAGTVAVRLSLQKTDNFDEILKQGAYVTSPSGTVYNVALMSDNAHDASALPFIRTHDIEGVFLRLTGFLGENTKSARDRGAWTVHVPGANIIDGNMMISGAEKGGVTEAVLNEAQALIGDPRPSMLDVLARPSVWELKKQNPSSPDDDEPTQQGEDIVALNRQKNFG